MTTVKTFHVGDVLSVTTGRLLSPTHMDGLYEILNFLTGANLFTHQLPEACRVAAPVLRRRHPELPAAITDEEIGGLTADGAKPTTDDVKTWVEQYATDRGLPLAYDLYPLHDGAARHDYSDPLGDLVAMVGPDRVVPIVIGDGTP